MKQLLICLAKLARAYLKYLCTLTKCKITDLRATLQSDRCFSLPEEEEEFKIILRK